MNANPIIILPEIIHLLETACTLSKQLNPVKTAKGEYIDYNFQTLSNKLQNTKEFVEELLTQYIKG